MLVYSSGDGVVAEGSLWWSCPRDPYLLRRQRGAREVVHEEMRIVSTHGQQLKDGGSYAGFVIGGW